MSPLILTPDSALLLSLSICAFAGIVVHIVADHFRQPAIGPLLLVGLVLGPSGFGVIHPDAIDPVFKPFLSVLVALILFEGGLTLNASRWHSIAPEIRGLLSIGVFVAWLGSAGLVFVLFDLPVVHALLAGSLVIVSGPTVVRPMLRRIRLKPPLPQILQWESVLIDPVGVFLTLLCFDWLVTQGDGWAHVGTFLARFSIGLIAGLVGGLVMSRILKSPKLPDHMVNMLVIACMMLVYSLCEAMAAESGLMAVVMAGLVISIQAGERMRRLVYFKRQITPLLISLLFVLLATKLELSKIGELGQNGLFAVLGVMFVVRPVSVFIGTFFSDTLGWKEKTALAWVAPKGIVAAAMSMLLSLELGQDYPVLGDFLVAFTYAIILSTILVQSLTAGVLARWLGVGRSDPGCWLVVGGNPFARAVARALKSSGNMVILLDHRIQRIGQARKEGLSAIHSDIFNLRLLDDPALVNVEQVICLTENDILNQLACRHLLALVGCNCVYRLTTTQETALNIKKRDKQTYCDSFGIPIWPQLGKVRPHFKKLSHGSEQVISSFELEDILADERTLPLFQIRHNMAQVLTSCEPPSDMSEGIVALVSSNGKSVAGVDVK
ncbi:MAG: sodium:proton antiporter [Magnetococcales bacterium]|nr:sodium:proton antiporter [Magnetococcales bacterium]